MKLGETLVRDGRITKDQLLEAMAVQARDGGRLGSILVELDMIDAETLTVYLGLELGIPIATGATLERCKRSAVRLLRPEQAARYRVIPIVIQGQTIIVAMDDPHDLVALDALSGITGYRVIPRVAPEIRIYYYLERFYGIPRPPRFAKLGEAPRGSRRKKPQHNDLPAPPLPGLPPRHEAPVPLSATVLRIRETTVERLDGTPPPVPPMAASSGAQRAQRALETEADDLVVALDEDDAEIAEAVEEEHRLRAATSPPLAPSSFGAPAADPRPAQLTLEEALAIMKGAEQRGQVADAILGHAAGVFETAVLLLVRDNMLYGWKGFGPGLDRDRIETLLIPLEAPSMFQIALHSDHLFRGRAFPASLHDHFFKVLRCPGTPHYSLVMVTAIGHRAVNMIYAHKRPGEETREKDVIALRKLTQASSEAYVRLISVTKRRRGESEENAPPAPSP